MSPMENLYGTAEGLPSDRTIAYFAERAEGGVGLITVGASSIDHLHKEVPNSLHFASDDVIESHRRLTTAVHSFGACIQPQLVHAGPDGLGPEMHQVEALGPSAIQSNLTGTASRALSVDEFAQIVDQYRAAAVRVRAAGYDGIELHAAHGYMLLGSFLTPWRNARRDRYSARKRDGAVAAVAEVVQAIKHEVGREFPLTLRISGFERIAGGRPSFDTQRIAPRLVDAGVDAFHVSGGVIDRFVTQMVNGSHDPDALNAAAARAVKNVVAVPVMLVGRIHTPEMAEQLLADESADLIVMGRPMIADPELPKKTLSGERSGIRQCISCQNCIDAMETRYAMDCAVNARAGRELDMVRGTAAASKRVVVVGSGPGGLEAARVAAERGHVVTIYERNHFLGGALLLAATVHPENQPLLDYLLHEVQRLGVMIKTGQEMDADTLEMLAPDVAILATGGKLVAPSFPGDDRPHVLTGAELRSLLAGTAKSSTTSKLPTWQKLVMPLMRPIGQRLVTPNRLRAATRRWMPLGENITIIGADLAAIELGEFLAERQRKVTILETSEQIAPEVGEKRRGEHMQRLDRARVAINTNVDIARISESGVVLRRTSGREATIAADNVIVAGQVEADTTLFDEIANRVARVHAIGDSTGLGLIQKAILEGAEAAAQI